MNHQHLLQSVAQSLATSLATYQALPAQAAELATIGRLLIDTLQGGGKLLLFGNGGSAADAQHVACEFVVRFRRERRGLPAIALTTDSSILTAIGNDYAFEQLFARQIEALGRPGDLAIGISTSGNSPDVLAGIRAAQTAGITTLGFSGRSGGELRRLADHCYCAPADTTANIQEAHLAAWHALCELVDMVYYASVPAE
ncbi:MAG TPA: SIS domain-containing protein [Roseiflexaceae bacterium]|nr:SIS domain-containing protein [Roseiflexaceae bacterium]